MAYKIFEEYVAYTYYNLDGSLAIKQGESEPNGYVVATEDNQIMREFESLDDAKSYIKRFEMLANARKESQNE